MKDKTLSADGYDKAFLGVFDRVGQPTVFVYDYDKCVELLMKADRMSNEDAEEYMQFNVVGGWVGTGTPAFLKLCSIEDAMENMENMAEDND